MRFLFIGSRFTLHACFPRSVTLTQLRFALLTVTSSQRDLHPQVCAHAGRTKKTPLCCHSGVSDLSRQLTSVSVGIRTSASNEYGTVNQNWLYGQLLYQLQRHRCSR